MRTFIWMGKKSYSNVCTWIFWCNFSSKPLHRIMDFKFILQVNEMKLFFLISKFQRGKIASRLTNDWKIRKLFSFSIMRTTIYFY